MNFDLSQLEKQIIDDLVGLLNGDVRADLESLEAGGDSDPAVTRRLLEHLGGIGYLGLTLGDSGPSDTTALVSTGEALAAASGSLHLAAETSARLLGGLVARFGSEKLKADLLEPIRGGKAIAAVAVSETEGDDATPGIGTTAVPDGDHFVLTGEKSFATNAPIADYIAVTADAGGKRAVFIVDAGAEGVEVGERLPTLGYEGLAVSPVRLDSVRVSADRTIGPSDTGEHLDYLKSMQDLILTIGSVGLMQRAIDTAKAWAAAHKRGGKPVARYQENRFKLAEMETMVQTARLLTFRAAWLHSIGDREAGTVLNCAKVFAAESSERTATSALQIMAAGGYISGNPAERAYREAKFAAIAGTTSEIARMSIADRMLEQYGV